MSQPPTILCPSGNFHAYVKDSVAGTDGTLQLVLFISRDTADLWWREVKKAKGKTVTRSSPECFTLYHESSLSFTEAIRGITDSYGDFIIRTFTYDNTGIPPSLPPPSRPDYLNGKSYFIRSAIKPDHYWKVEQTRNWVGTVQHSIRLSQDSATQYPTRFKITRVVPLPYTCVPSEDVLVPTDVVYLSFSWSTSSYTAKNVDLRKCDLRALEDTNSKERLEVPFGMLLSQRGFCVVPDTNGSTVAYHADGFGDVWELVD